MSSWLKIPRPLVQSEQPGFLGNALSHGRAECAVFLILFDE